MSEHGWYGLFSRGARDWLRHNEKVREAVHQLVMGNELITCSARFGGVAQELTIPVDCVAAIYARENGHGMAFEVTPGQTVRADLASASVVDRGDQPVLTTPDKPVVKPHLRRIK